MLKNISITLINSFIRIKRFSLASLCILAFFSLNIKLFEIEQTEFYMKILFCGCLWFVALKLLFESLNFKIIYYYIIGIAIFLLMSLYIYKSSLAVFILLATGLFISIFVAAFIFKKEAKSEIWNFNYNLLVKLFFTGLISLIFFIACSLIMLSIDFLFELDPHHKFFKNLWISTFTLIAPLLTIANIPNNFNNTEIKYPSSLRNILSYVIIPSLLIYALIFYIYCIKIIITMALPKGSIVYITSTFSTIGIITYIISHPLHNSPGIINLFSRYFFKILLLPLILLALAIGIRINQYGITESRYIVILGLIWFSLCSFFAIFKNRSGALRPILLSIVLLLIGSCFGPWGIDNIIEKYKLKDSDIAKISE